MILAIVGMAGAGKTEAAQFIESKGFMRIRFGQITIDELKARGLEINEENERMIREKLRAEHGMHAFAKLNASKIDKALESGDVVIDGLYSWEEYIFLRERYPKNLFVMAIYAPSKLRYARLTARSDASDKDKNMRPLSEADAIKRDIAEIENLHKAGPIAMADMTIINDASIEGLKNKIARGLHRLLKTASR